MNSMRRVLQQPRLVFGTFVPILVATWFLSAIGDDLTPSDGGLYWVGAGAWMLFGLTLLVTAAYAVAQVVRLMRRRSSA